MRAARLDRRVRREAAVLVKDGRKHIVYVQVGAGVELTRITRVAQLARLNLLQQVLLLSSKFDSRFNISQYAPEFDARRPNKENLCPVLFEQIANTLQCVCSSDVQR